MFCKVSFIITIITLVVDLVESYPNNKHEYYQPGKKFIHKNKQVHLFLRQPFVKPKEHHYHHHHFHDDEIGEHNYYVENYNHDRPNPPKYKKKKTANLLGADYHYYNPHGAYKFHEQLYGPYKTKKYNTVNYQVFHNGHHHNQKRFKRQNYDYNQNDYKYSYKYGPPPYFQHDPSNGHPIYFYC